MADQKHILVAPLNWGLGHATRCIPIINALMAHGFTPIIATDGAALALLQAEFPGLICLKLPGYQISYAKTASFFTTKLLFQTPKILKTIAAEKKEIAKIVSSYHVVGIISDNRFGAYHPNIPCVFITHQLQVLSGLTTRFSTHIHNSIIKKFNTCWVPDASGTLNFSGRMGHVKQPVIKTNYLGPLSRFKKINTPILYDLLVLLSGPEPQRQILETKLLNELNSYSGKIVFIKGVVEKTITKKTTGNMCIYNYLTADRLEQVINQSELVLSRSGYTTIMDLATLQKKAFFIPTPGQFEQTYLAKRLKKQGLAPYCQQDKFTSSALEAVKYYKGLHTFKQETDFKDLFSLFQTK
ncbi:glycosyltransferase [Bizionia sediminis]|uniref:Glycosyltransferase n=1 Tax=Bizionia sediminis TaxID=1737064 RepID=A0ABW5KS48_9FLAO